MFVPCVSDHYSRSTYTHFVASQPLTRTLSLSLAGGSSDGSWVKWGGWGVDVLNYKLVVVIVAGALLLARNKEPRTTDTSLLTPFLSPTLTFLPFWKSMGVSEGGCEVDVCGACD